VRTFDFDFFRSFLLGVFFLNGFSKLKDSPSNHGFGIPNGWICLADDRAILSVEVLAGQRVSGVAHNDSVRIQHRHQLENELVPQPLGHRSVSRDEVHQTLHHPRGRSLTGMHTSRHHNRLLSLFKIRIQNIHHIVLQLFKKDLF